LGYAGIQTSDNLTNETASAVAGNHVGMRRNIMKCIIINPAARSITEGTYTGPDDLRAILGGWFATAYVWESGDALYVDDEGLMKPNEHFFRISLRGDDQPLAGVGVIVGAEKPDRSGYITLPPTITVEALEAAVSWMSRASVEAWGQANASRPAMTFTTFGADGSEEKVVLTTYGQLIGDMPKAN
jgi:hypothetical protein